MAGRIFSGESEAAKRPASGRMIAGAYLRAGMGGVVTCVKAEDLEMWRRYAAEHGRGGSLLLFDANEGFNFLTYFLALYGMEGIGTVTEALMKIVVTFLTQSLPNYYVKMTGNDPRDAAHSLVGKFNTHIYHSNACTETNEYASRMIGKVLTRLANYSRGNSDSYTSGLSQGSSEISGTSSGHGSSSSSAPGGGTTTGTNSSSGHSSSTGSNWGMNQSRGTSSNTSRGYTESMEFAIEPGDFARVLRTGGRANGNLVTGVWFEVSRVFKDSASNFMLETFAQ